MIKHLPQPFQQRPRWYPTSAILANGSILTIGGLDTSTNVQQGNLEVFPKPAGGDTVVDLDWLSSSSNDLYPFVTVLPSTHLFVGGLYLSLLLTMN